MVNEIRVVSIKDISPNPYQPRKSFSTEALDDLAASIRENGLIQYPVVRMVGDAYILVAGERRLRALKLLDWEETPVLLSGMSESEAAAAAVVENLQREDVNALEEAEAIATMIERIGLTQADVARKLGLSQAKISQKLSLLDLTAELQKLYMDGLMSQSVGRILSLLPAEVQNQTLPNVQGMTAKAAQSVVNVYKRLETMRSLTSLNAKCYCGLLDEGCVNLAQTSINLIQGGLLETDDAVPVFALSIPIEDSSPELLELVRTYQKILAEAPNESPALYTELVMLPNRGKETAECLERILRTEAEKDLPGVLEEMNEVRVRLETIMLQMGDMIASEEMDGETLQELGSLLGEMEGFLSQYDEPKITPAAVRRVSQKGRQIIERGTRFMQTTGSAVDNSASVYLEKKPPSIDNPARKRLVQRLHHLAKMAYAKAGEASITGQTREACLDMHRKAHNLATGNLHGKAFTQAYREVQSLRLRAREVYLEGEGILVEGKTIQQLVSEKFPEELYPPLSGESWVIIDSVDSYSIYDPYTFRNLFPVPVYRYRYQQELNFGDQEVSVSSEDPDVEIVAWLPASLVRELETRMNEQGAAAVRAFLMRELK